MFCSDGVALMHFRVGSITFIEYIVGVCANCAGGLCWGWWAEVVNSVMFRQMLEGAVHVGCEEGSVDMYWVSLLLYSGEEDLCV